MLHVRLIIKYFFLSYLRTSFPPCTLSNNAFFNSAFSVDQCGIFKELSELRKLTVYMKDRRLCALFKQHSVANCIKYKQY